MTPDSLDPRERAREALGRPLHATIHGANCTTGDIGRWDETAGILLAALDADPEARAALLAYLLPVERLAAALRPLIRDFNWQSENVSVLLGPVPYGPGAWSAEMGNPDGNIALALALRLAGVTEGEPR